MREETIFHEARRMRGAERATFLARACAPDADLRRRVEALLNADEDPAALLSTSPLDALASSLGTPVIPPAVEQIRPPHQPDGSGSRIGPYVLLEPLGEGGMGTVFKAEQGHPVRRTVALKIIKPGMDSRQVIARFEVERQALAMMDHPNIARVLDVGTTGAGRPYFVMELVEGLPITRYCDEHRLTPRQRLDLFLPVCRAVQHAHQKGVIHRDLKPSNVLVAPYDGRPVPKVIDFGIAKATGPHVAATSSASSSSFTEFGAVVGTVEYMSPEQAGLNPLDIDTRSDVYSLGVMLYELLTGSTPLESQRVKTAALLEALRLVREEEAPRPSTRLSAIAQLRSVAASRGLEPRKLAGLVRRELDWIVMRALEKDRTRRYETVSGLAGDIERYLNDEPVQACPPTAGYRLRKFAKRHRRGLAMTAVASAVVLAAATSLLWDARNRAIGRDATAREAAGRRHRANAEAGRMWEEAALLRDRGDWPQAVAAARQAEWLLVDGGGGEAEQARVRVMRADLEMASALESIRLRRGTDGSPGHAALVELYAKTFVDYGIDVMSLDPPTAAERIRTSGIRAALSAALDDWMWINTRAVTTSRGRVHGGLVLRRKFPADTYERLRAVADLLSPDDWCRRVRDPGVHKDRIALEELAARAGPVGLPPSTAMLLARLLGRAGAAGPALDVLFAAQRRAPDDFAVNCELSDLLAHAVKPARPEEAVGFMRAAVALRPRSSALQIRLGKLLEKTGRVDEALAAYRKAVELAPQDAWPYRTLAKALWATGDHAGAVAVYRQAVAANVPRVRYDLYRALYRAGQWKEAVEALRAAADASPDLAPTHADLAWLLATCPEPALRDVGEAAERARRAIAIHPELSGGWAALGAASYRAGDWDGAVAALEKAGELGASHRAWFFLAMAHWQRDDQESARRAYDRGVRPRGIARFIGPNEEFTRLRDEAAELIGLPKTTDRDTPQPTTTPTH